MKVNTNIIIASSDFSGFKNYMPAKPFSVSYGGGNIAAGGYVGPLRASTLLSNSNSVSQVKVRFTGIESFYRVIPGTFFVDYPSKSARTYEIEVFTYFQGGSVVVDVYIINETGGVVAIPAITFDCLATSYLSPF